MLTAVPLPDRPLTILWQSTVIDVEPGTRYAHAHDTAEIATTLAVANDTGQDLTFPLILASTDQEEPTIDHVRVRLAHEQPTLSPVDHDAEWDALAAAITAQGLSRGHDEERTTTFVASLRGQIRRAYKSEPMTVVAGGQCFIRSYLRKLIYPGDGGVFTFRGLFPLPLFAVQEGGSISVIVNAPRATQRFDVDLVDWTRNYWPQAFGKDPGLPRVAGRHAVSWLWGNDPELTLSYAYSGDVVLPGRSDDLNLLAET
jgi:hypothetical protein